MSYKTFVIASSENRTFKILCHLASVQTFENGSISDLRFFTGRPITPVYDI